MHARTAIAAALPLLLLASGCAGSTRPTAARSRSTPVAVSPPVQRTLAENRSDAIRAAKRAVRTMSMPPGSRRMRHSPVPDLAHQNEGIGPSNPRLQQTTWWAVPLDGSALLDWLRHHHPRGMHLSGDVDAGMIQSRGRWIRTTEYDGRSTAAHTGLILLLEYQSTPAGTAIRGSTWVSARRPRPASTYVHDATSVDVLWQSQATTGRHFSRTRTRHLDPTAPSDRRTIARLEKLVNDLVGSPVPAPIAHCPMLLVDAVDKITFEMTGDPGPRRLTFRLEPGCLGQVTVTRDGHRLTGTLDPGRLASIVPRVARASR